MSFHCNDTHFKYEKDVKRVKRVISFILLAREKKTGFYHSVVFTGWSVENNYLFTSLKKISASMKIF